MQSAQNFNRMPIIGDTTKSVRPVRGEDVFGDECAGLWLISIDCPVYGKEISPVGPFENYAAAMDSIKEGLF
jgi:hypothetical protein